MSSPITVPRVANRLLPQDLADFFKEHCDLGLKLESSRGPVEVFVIDHVEKPGDN
jgi:uncharacterized protein (TIGR03435 family)